MSHCQHTLKNPIQARGIGLHSGETVRLTLKPAPEDFGIRFRRVDLEAVSAADASADASADRLAEGAVGRASGRAARRPSAVEIQALHTQVVSTRLATTLANGAVQISTVEHLLSALAGVGIDNAIVEVDAAELPIMDGSAAPFVFLLQSAGIAPQRALRRYLRIKEAVTYIEDDVTAMLVPYDGFQVEYTLDYDHPVLSAHSNKVEFEFSTTAYQRELSRARTFGLLQDFEVLKANNLARGGTFDNALVVGDQAILNDRGLRLRDEFARHKVLDAIGDLYLLGYPLIGRFVGYKSGHGPNLKLLERLLARPDSFELVTFSDDAAVPGGYRVEPLAATA